MEAVKAVCVDGLVILKILKHCRESFPSTVAGTLLGVESEGVCEVTHSFASPASADDDHVTRMIKALRETNVDNMAVGWYSSTYLGSFYTKDNVEHQAEYQAEVPNSVLLVYDNVPTAQGLLSIKALRLTKSFMEEWRNQGRLGSEAFTRLPPSAVFEELPVKVRNTHLVQAFLADVIDSKSLGSSNSVSVPRQLPSAGGGGGGSGGSSGHHHAGSSIAASLGAAVGATPAAVAAAEQDTDFARLDLATGPFLEKHLEVLQEFTDQFLQAQASARYTASDIASNVRQREEWLRLRRKENEKRRAEGLEALPETDASLAFFKPVADRSGREPLDTLLLSAQISSYCSSVNKFADQSFGKLFLASHLAQTQGAKGV